MNNMDRLLEHIENMKQKPEHVRNRYAFLVSFAVTFVIFMGWIGSYAVTTSPSLAEGNPNTAAVADVKVEGPIRSVIGTAGGFLKDVKNIFVGTNQFEYRVESNIEVKPGNR
jgi:hypothetical protein